MKRYAVLLVMAVAGAAAAPAAGQAVATPWSAPTTEGLQTRMVCPVKVFGPGDYATPMRLELRHKSGKSWARNTIAHGYTGGFVVTDARGSAVVRESVKLKFNTAVDGVGVLATFSLAGRKAIIDRPGRYTVRFVGSVPSAVNRRRGLVALPATPSLALEIRAVFKGLLAGLPQVTRKADADRVALKDGKILLGTIENRKYTVSAFFGKIEVPAKDVVGLVQADKKFPHPRLILTSGQVVAGELAGKTVQLVPAATGKTVQVPVESIREFGYRISKEKPSDPTSPGAMVLLASGNRLAWTEMKHKLQLVTSYATVDLPTVGIRMIELGSKTVPGRRVLLANGSTLTGTLLPNRLKLKLKLGPIAEVDDLQVLDLVGPAKPAVPAGGEIMVMRNGDRLLGRILDKTLTLKSALGAVKIRTTSIFKIEFDATRADTVTVKTWGGGVMKAQLVEPVVTFAIVPNGPTVKANSRQIVSITRSVASPPPEMLKKIEKLIAQLGAESYVDREKAQKELIAMGKSIAELLKKYLAETRDPEIRQRLGEIIKVLGG